MDVYRHTHSRYDQGMRTNIEIDDELMAKALKLSDLKTKKAVVHAALEEFVELRDTNRKLLEIMKSIDPSSMGEEWLADYEAHRMR